MNHQVHAVDWSDALRCNDSGSTFTPAAIEQLDAPFEVAALVVPAGQHSPVDHHESHEMWLTTRGTGHLTCDGVDLPLREGETVFIPAGREHVAHADPTGELVVTSIAWRT